MALAAPTRHMIRAPTWAWAVFIALCAGYVALCAYYLTLVGPFVFDDVFIIFRYADNFARGHGLVYNPGEAVEGYTSFTWTLAMGCLAALGVPLIVAGQALGVMLGLGTLALTWWMARRLVGPQNHWLALFAVAFVTTSRSAAVWAVEPLETKLFGFSIVVTMAVWMRAGSGGRLRGVPVVGLAAAFMALTRPEGLMYAGWLLVAGFGPARREGQLSGLLINAGTFLGIISLHLVFRVSVYDAWLPNTFAAKVTGLQLDLGAHYLSLLAEHNVLVLSGAWVAAGLFAGRAARDGDKLRPWCAAVLISSFVYWLLVGGDYFEFRFFEPLLAPWALMAALGLSAVGERIRPSWRTRAAVGLATFTLLGNASSILWPYQAELETKVTTPERSRHFTKRFTLAARWLATNVPRDESLAIRPAGVIAYLTRLHCLDELGLNDRRIATMDNVVADGPVGHQRLVSLDYLRARGATYYVGDPRIKRRPAAEGLGIISAEVAPGRFMWIDRLDPNAKLEDRVYWLDESRPPLVGWQPVQPPSPP